MRSSDEGTIYGTTHGGVSTICAMFFGIDEQLGRLLNMSFWGQAESRAAGDIFLSAAAWLFLTCE